MKARGISNPGAGLACLNLRRPRRLPIFIDLHICRQFTPTPTLDRILQYGSLPVCWGLLTIPNILIRMKVRKMQFIGAQKML